MAVTFYFKKMTKLLDNFYYLTKVRYSMIDANNNLLCKSAVFASPFCSALRKTVMKNGNLGDELCVKCDTKFVKYVSTEKMKYYTYRCHAQLLETIIPLHVADENIGYIFLGQYLDESDLDVQWGKTKESLQKNFVDIDVEKLKGNFYDLQILSDLTLISCVEIIVACFNYISAECLIKNTPLSNFQLLYDFINENYMNALSIDLIANELSISKTKLCNIANSHGQTVNGLIRAKRLSTAKTLLENTSLSISEIAVKVGIDDFAYFTKIFKEYYGLTPSQYKKRDYDPF